MNEEIDKQGKLFEDDTILVKAFQSGDKKAFDRLVLGHMNRIFNLCYRFLGNREEANDSAQETFIKAYRSLNEFELRSSFSTWIYKIAINTCKNRVKSAEYRNAEKTVSIDENVRSNEGGEHNVEMGNEVLSPANVLDRKETSTRIQSAIDSLPDEQREVVVLRDIEGLSYEEIAEITGNELGTVKSKLARAREKLREKLKGLI